MANMLIAHADLSDSATLSATSANANYPLSNLKNMQPSKVFRTTSASSQNIDVQLPAGSPMDLWALIRCNITAAGTVRVRTAATQAALSSAPSYDSGVLPFTAPADYPNRAFYHYKPAPVSDVWVRFTIDDPTNADGYIEIGRLIAAKGFIPTRNYSYGGGIGYVDSSIVDRTQGSQAYVREVPRYKFLELEANLTRAEALGTVLDLDRRRGGARDYLVMLDPADSTYVHQQSIYGLSKDLAPIIRPHLNLYTKRYRLEEIL